VRAALYARVSTERQADRGTIGSQLQLLHQHIAEVGDELVGEYVDDGGRGGQGGHQREVAAMPSHHLNDEGALVAGGGAAQGIHRLDDPMQRGVAPIVMSVPAMSLSMDPTRPTRRRTG
jgi:hypothetical protein